MTKNCACGCPKSSGDFEGICGCPAQEVCLCVPGCEYCDNPNVPAPWAAGDAAATRLQAWLDAVREHGRRDTGYPDEDDVDALLADHSRMAAELEQVRGERDDDAERIEYATDLLTALARTSPCLQEKGGCIAHDRYLPEGSDCPHGLARAFLAGAKAHRRAETIATRPADGKRTPEQWCAEYGIDIADPDGWRNTGDPAWDEPITLPDFLRRAARSTCRGLTPDVWNRLSREAHEAADAEKGSESP